MVLDSQDVWPRRRHREPRRPVRQPQIKIEAGKVTLRKFQFATRQCDGLSGGFVSIGAREVGRDFPSSNCAAVEIEDVQYRVDLSGPDGAHWVIASSGYACALRPAVRHWRPTPPRVSPLRNREPLQFDSPLPERPAACAGAAILLAWTQRSATTVSPRQRQPGRSPRRRRLRGDRSCDRETPAQPFGSVCWRPLTIASDQRGRDVRLRLNRIAVPPRGQRAQLTAPACSRRRAPRPQAVRPLRQGSRDRS